MRPVVPATPKAVSSPSIAPHVGRAANPGTKRRKLVLGPPEPMVILEEILVSQAHRGLGEPPEIDAALARLEVLRKCAGSELEVLELPSLESRASLRVGILRRFDSDQVARGWLAQIKHCAPRSRVEKVSTYILNR
jgi:hypothetical protein